ncbi:MAG: hypothetical protein IJS80_00295 [Lachnospiraceae bacterium]|nr:hypothetical protein [Lachnospiraceae bacterium]
MIQKIPELYDPENAEDRYMFHTLSAFMYLQATERFAGGTFDPKGKGAGKTLVGTRMSQAMDVMMFGINDADYGLIKLLDKLENDDPSVKWDEEIIYSPLKNEEPVLISKTIEKMERKIAKDSKSKEASKAARTLKDQDFSTGLSSPKTSDLMKNVKTTYFTIDQKLKEPIPDNETLFNRTVEEIREIYIELIRSCTLYEEKRNPWTDLGKKRKEMVHTIRMNALSEMDNLGINADKYYKSGKGGTYGDIIGDKQRDRALINGDMY